MNVRAGTRRSAKYLSRFGHGKPHVAAGTEKSGVPSKSNFSASRKTTR